MHIYCDESGGTDAASGEFLIGAVLIAPGDADRLVRAFRKKVRLGEEIKGHKLLPDDRERFFAMLSEVGHSACAVGCVRTDPIGGMVMRTQPEIRLWRGLIAEALTRPSFAAGNGVTLDQGRYSKEARNREMAALADELAGRWGRRWPIHTGDSRRFAGLQVADVVVNTALHATRFGAEGEWHRGLLQHAGVALLLTAPASLTPEWATQPA